MAEKKSILIWVFEDEMEALLKRKRFLEQTWREFILTLAGIPHPKITMGRPRTKGE